MPTSTEIRASQGRIPELDGLRGLAILMVILLHYVADARGGEFGSFLYRFKNLFRLGWSGVDLFFILSGFLIGGILFDARESPNYFKAFYLRRVHRILPIYYLWVSLFVVASVVASHWIPAPIAVSAGSAQTLPFYYLFLQNFISQMHGTLGWYWLAAMWSLAIEEQFYLVAPLLVRFLSTRSLTIALSATVLLVPVLRAVMYHYDASIGGHGYYYVLTPFRADSLALGMLAAIAWRTPQVAWVFLSNRKAMNRVLLILALGLPVMLKWFPGPSSHVTAVLGYSWLAMFFAALLLSVLSNREGILAQAMRSPFLIRLGGISYCVYLIHLLVNGMCHALFLHSSPAIDSLPGVSVTMLAAALTWAIAEFSWKYFEGPLMRRGHRYTYWPKSVPVPAVELAPEAVNRDVQFQV
jgi:peptidoglycan/LPS O-acetylase OafA/YrhL